MIGQRPPSFSPRVAIIGAGSVGSTAAYATAIRNIVSDIVLIDINEQKEAGEVMDIADGLCFMETGGMKGGDFTDAQNADVIVLTAGAPQKPGETRLELVDKNVAIVKTIFKKIGRVSRSAMVLVVANPVDVLTALVQNITGLHHAQVFGSGTTLDTARLKTHVARLARVSPHDVHGYVLGEHGDTEFVAWSTVTVGGVPIQKLPFFSASRAKKIEDSIRKEAYEIIQCKGATFFGIGLVIADILEAIFYNQHKILPLSTQSMHCETASHVCLGTPVVLGRRGIERQWPLSLTVAGLTAEQAAWKPGPERHSIWQIVRHLIRWKEGVLVALEGAPRPYREISDRDWEEAGGDQAGWRYLPSMRDTPDHCLPDLPTPTG